MITDIDQGRKSQGFYRGSGDNPLKVGRTEVTNYSKISFDLTFISS